MCCLKPGDKKTIAHKLAIWLLNTATICMVSCHHLFNVFAKFHGFSTVINFAKANRSVCVDQNVGKKLDVAASDEAALFFIIQCSCRNEFTNLIKISHCWLNKVQAMQDH